MEWQCANIGDESFTIEDGATGEGYTGGNDVAVTCGVDLGFHGLSLMDGVSYRWRSI